MTTYRKRQKTLFKWCIYVPRDAIEITNTSLCICFSIDISLDIYTISFSFRNIYNYTVVSTYCIVISKRWKLMKHYELKKKTLFFIEEHERMLQSGSQSSKITKRQRLHELFRPPVDIVHDGNFQSVSTNIKFL